MDNSSYAELQQAYVQQQAELAELEEDNEEVSDQLEAALEQLQQSRDEHRAAVQAHSHSRVQNAEIQEQAIINENRLDSVENQLTQEIRRREEAEKKLAEAQTVNAQLWTGLTLVVFIALVATAAAIYFKILKPRVVLIQGGQGADESTVQNSTVVMGRAVGTESAKESNVHRDDLKGSGTSTADLARNVP